ncbi:unnamed protein product [Chironomus riparius]|uniref:Ionotropic receptor n=1 Tax=Chironomus riparius TaxID=315576 RepID=A0A9N9S0C0_9DIPT|nr:unnamed protein product [Chironomus riparius]
MKSIILLLLSFQVAVNAIIHDLDVMSQAITDLIQELFIKNQMHFDILMYGNLTQNSIDIMNMIEMKNDGNFAEKIHNIQPDLWDHKIYKSAVIFVANEQTVNELNAKASLESPYPHRISFLMYFKLVVDYMMTSIDRFTFEPTGPIVDLFKAMAYTGNFTYNYQLVFIKKYPDSKKYVEELPKDGIIIRPNAHFQRAILAFSGFDHIHFLTLFGEEKVSCLLTLAESYGSYEKLIFPFDYWTWIYLLIVFGFTFILIFVVNMLPCKVQDLVYGENVMTPAVNVGGIFFGMSQTQVPFKNFSRIILITFILFCLVIRTAYQGVLFEMIAADIKKPLPETFHELYLRNYSIHAIDAIGDSLKAFIPEYLSQTTFLSMFDFEESVLQRINDSSSKIAFCNFRNILELYQFQTQTKNIYLKENLYSTVNSFFMFKHNFLYQLADETLQGLLSNVNKLPRRVQHTFCGENVMTPAQNTIAIFFGIPQTQVPLRNFPRLILITFILFCLVIRTAYQGVLFKTTTTDIRKPLPRSFHDLHMRFYSIHAIDLIETSLERFLPKEQLGKRNSGHEAAEKKKFLQQN